MKMFLAFFINLIALSLAAVDQLGVDQCNCRSKVTNKIVGGQVAESNAYPWQISIADSGNNHLCSGVIINKQWVATTLSCVNYFKPEDLYIRVGVHDLTEPSNEDTIFQVEEIKTNEIQFAALLKLKNPIFFSTGIIEPACFTEFFTVYQEPLVATGWGTTTKTVLKEFSKKLEHGELSNVLKEMNYYVDYKVDCPRQFVCAKELNQGESVCDGDEGGPIHYTQNGRTTVEGLLHPLEMKKDFFNKNYCIGEAKFISIYDCKNWFKKVLGNEHC